MAVSDCLLHREAETTTWMIQSIRARSCAGTGRTTAREAGSPASVPSSRRVASASCKACPRLQRHGSGGASLLHAITVTEFDDESSEFGVWTARILMALERREMRTP